MVPRRCRTVAARRAALLLALPVLAGCAALPPSRPAAAVTQLALPAPSSRTAPARESEVAGKPVLLNDPPASADSPLCGKQAREASTIGTSLPRLAGAGGRCAGFACYDPLTATYLGEDGYRHVCR